VGLKSGGGVGDDRFAVADGDVLAGELLTLIETDQCCSLKVTTLALVQGSAM